MRISFSAISKYKGMFEKCTVEEALNGLSIFDVNGNFIGMIQPEGFSLNGSYEYAKQIATELANRDISFWDDETAEKLKIAEIENQ